MVVVNEGRGSSIKIEDYQYRAKCHQLSLELLARSSMVLLLEDGGEGGRKKREDGWE